MGEIVRSLVLSLGLTLLLELGAALVFGLRKGRDLLLVALVNILTNPIVVLVWNLTNLYTQVAPPRYLVAVLEIAAILTEGALYRLRLETNKWNPFVLSLILNAISFFGGLLL